MAQFGDVRRLFVARLALAQRLLGALLLGNVVRYAEGPDNLATFVLDQFLDAMHVARFARTVDDSVLEVISAVRSSGYADRLVEEFHVVGMDHRHISRVRREQGRQFRARGNAVHVRQFLGAIGRFVLDHVPIPKADLGQAGGPGEPGLVIAQRFLDSLTLGDVDRDRAYPGNFPVGVADRKFYGVQGEGAGCHFQTGYHRHRHFLIDNLAGLQRQAILGLVQIGRVLGIHLIDHFTDHLFVGSTRKIFPFAVDEEKSAFRVSDDDLHRNGVDERPEQRLAVAQILLDQRGCPDRC